MKTNELHFTDAWKLPFQKDSEGYCVYIWSSNNKIAFNFLGEYSEIDIYNRIVDLLNGKKDANPFKRAGRNDRYIAVSDDAEQTQGSPILLVRGWGHLTGVGGLHLDNNTATRLQEELMDYCITKLLGKEDR